MLITGHNELIETALERLAGSMRTTGKGSSVLLDALKHDRTLTLMRLWRKGNHPDPLNITSHINFDKLIQGLNYPDFPCGHYDIIKGRVVMTNASLCPIHKMAHDIKKRKGFENDRLTFAYSSHKGRFSTLHSMTFNPSTLVHQLRDMILHQAMVFATLSIHDTVSESTYGNPKPNIFWLGNLIHMVQDSYSPAHVVRSNTFKSGTAKEKKFIKVLKYLSKEEHVTRDLDDITQELASAFVLRAVQKAVKESKQFPNRKRVGAFLRNFAKEDGFPFNVHSKLDNMIDLFLSYYIFETPLEQPTERLNNKTYRQILARHTSHPQVHKIINFQYYNNQDSKKHALMDTLAFVKRYGLFEDAVRDTVVILDMYSHAIHEIAIEGKSCEDVAPVFASMVAKYLQERTLCIEKDCSHLMTGFDVDEIKSEFKEALTVRAFSDVLL